MARFVLVLVLLGACASSPATVAPAPPAPWQPWDAATFARASAERRPLLVHMAAAWCHWCHVMERETYTDPTVAALVRERFVPIRIDSDARPDLADRFADYAWPGTIILSSDAATILAAYRGFIPPERMVTLLSEALTTKPTTMVVDLEPSAPLDALPWVARQAELALADRWDPKYFGWGRPKRAPNGAALGYTCSRADPAARTRAAQLLAAQEATLDPVWGGFYQYSETPDWRRPHFEKLVDQQGWMLEGLALCIRHGVSPERARLQASAILRWLDGWMTTPEGLVMTAQDADLDEVSGRDFYARDDAGRRALGRVPWIDTHVYARENGLVLAGLAALVEATDDPMLRARGQRLADAARARWPTLPERDALVHLDDAAALGLGLARWAQVSGDAAARAAAEALWSAALTTFAGDGAALLESGRDPNAVGLFAVRRAPFDANVRMARCGRALGHEARADAILGAVATPSALVDQGSWLGDFLLATAKR